MRVSAGSAVKYATLPGLVPRIKGLFFTGFGPVTQLVALICYMVGLLPRNHPCFSRKTKDQYGLVKILAIAANQVEFKWKNIDQIVILTAIFCGTVMMFLYMMGLVFFVLISPASALGLLIPDMLVTVAPEHDIAFMMLDRTFGVPDVFNSCVSLGTPCYAGDPATNPFPTPFQFAMQELFGFYSMGIFFLALFIFLYHIVHIVFEVTQTGKMTDHLSDDVMAPYADSPSKGFAWLPIRFVVAFGLLLPFGEGFNSAQWITLYAAKYGSGLATNTWIQYNIETGDTPTGELNQTLVSKPNVQDSSGLIKSLLLMRACRDIHSEYNSNVYALSDEAANNKFNYAPGMSYSIYDVKPYLINGSNMMPFEANPYTVSAAGIAGGSAADSFIQALDFSGMSDIRIVWGVYLEDDKFRYAQYPGGVLPVCGEVTIPVTGRTGEALFAAEGYLFAVMHMFALRPGLYDRAGAPQTLFEQNLYVASSREFNRISSDIKRVMQRPYTAFPRECFWDHPNFGNPQGDGYEGYLSNGLFLGNCHNAVPSSYWNELINSFYQPLFAVPAASAYDFLAGTSVATVAPFLTKSVPPNTPEAQAGVGRSHALGGTAWNAVGAQNPFLMTAGILEYGWGGAGLWYNKISERNGSLYTAATSMPLVKKFPMVMEQIKAERVKTDTKIGSEFCETYSPRKSGKGSTYNPGENSQFAAEQATALYNLCSQLFENENVNLDGITRVSAANSPVEAAINAIFSEFKSYDIETNKEVTPMAQLSSIGRMLIDKAILGFMGATASAAAGGLMHMSASAEDVGAVPEFLGTMSGVLVTFAMLGLTAGVMLHYILPFMPFVYFFFAVGRWVKTIFEAMVGVPLWAFAHMQTGGKGLAGDAASGGYFLLLEIFIRPVITVFSLVGAFAIFSALAVGLNTVFTLIGTNLFGAAPPPNGAAGMVNVLELSRGATDQFFLTMFYVLIMYVIGTACFKLIDLIPDNIMRWSGAGVQTIGAADISDDLLYQWETELPYRIESMAKEAGDLAREVLYKPGAAKHHGEQAALQQAVAEQRQATQAEQVAQQERAQAEQAKQSGNADLARKEEMEARRAEMIAKKEREEAQKAAQGIDPNMIERGTAKADEAAAKAAEAAKNPKASPFSSLKGFFKGEGDK